MKKILKTIALAVAVATVPAAVAQTLSTRHPMAEKYRDAGTKPAAGRSGSAGIEARALIDRLGVTDVEVTTGHFDALGGGGTLAKVQVKLLAPNGDVMQTDNYRKTPAGNGYASFMYDNMRRGQTTQVQASVTGIDPNRTDVVTVSTPVMLRPDLQASLTAPPTATLNTMTVVSGVMSEGNGEVGARGTCRLLVDGIEIASIPGAWVDAGSAVTCRFQTSFATTGTKQLTLRITDVSPGDFDSTNNEATRSIDVVPPLPLPYMSASVWEGQGREHIYQETTFYRNSGEVSRATREVDATYHRQSLFVDGYFYAASPMDSGQIILRQATGATVLPMLAVNVADLPSAAYGDYSCRWGNFPGFYASICSDAGSTYFYIGRDVGDAVYMIDRATASGVDFSWYPNYDYSGATYSVPGLVAFGSSYQAELRHEANAIAHAGVIEVALAERRWDQDDAGLGCHYFYYDFGYETYCRQVHVHARYLEGSNYLY